MKNQITKQKLQQLITSRFAVRWHMTLIIAVSFLAGLITTKFLLMVGNSPMLVRYPLALLIAYLVFLCGVWMWMQYTGYARYFRKKHRDEYNDWNIDLPNFMPDSAAKTDFVPSHGGEFGGGGASGSWDAPSLESSSGDNLDIVGGAAEALGGAEEGGCFIAILVLIGLTILAVIFGAGVYFIYEAPIILTEVAFEALLAGGLVHVSKRMRHDASWSGSVINVTWPAFAFVLIGSILFAFTVARYVPEAKTFSEVISKVTFTHGKS
jgi:hypothetical protein